MRAVNKNLYVAKLNDTYVPSVVDCFILGEEYPEWFEDKVSSGEINENVTVNESPFDGLDIHTNTEVKTSEGVMLASNGDYVVRGIGGEIRPYKPSAFHELYDVESYYEVVGEESNES